jgi:hypothetical protein
MVDITRNLDMDIIARYLGGLPKTLATAAVPAYFTFDVRVALHGRHPEIVVVGQNLFARNHKEFDVLNMPRSVYLKLALRL